MKIYRAHLILGVSFALLSAGAAAPSFADTTATPAAASATNTADGITAAKTALTGKVNIAKGKTADASSTQDGNPVSNGVDGDATTRWCASDQSAPQWYSVDLGTSQGIAGFEIKWEQPSNAYTYKLEVSDDKQTWKTVADRTQNTYANQDDFVLTPGATGRYARVTVTAATMSAWVSLYEFEVYGK